MPARRNRTGETKMQVVVPRDLAAWCDSRLSRPRDKTVIVVNFLRALQKGVEKDPYLLRSARAASYRLTRYSRGKPVREHDITPEAEPDT